MYIWNLLGFNLNASPFVLPVDAIICSYQDFVHIDQILLRLFSFMPNYPCSHSFSSYERLSNPLNVFVALCWTVSVMLLSLL